MRIVCCDDDHVIGEIIKEYLKEYFQKNEIPFPEYSFYESGEELLRSVALVDIAFLDIEMEGVNGIQVGVELKKRNPNTIVFVVTSYPDYLDEAMRFQVFRYLSKPIDKNRLFRNMKDALFQYSTVVKKIQIETKSETEVVYMRDIIFVEAKDRKVFVYTKDQVYQSVHNMQFWEEKLLSGNFFQTHRSYIVNFRFVTKFDNTVVHLYDNRYIAYLTRRKYVAFKNAYLMYLESLR